jgi:serine phosphatase RsbU (regulator of sigma subunit)
VEAACASRSDSELGEERLLAGLREMRGLTAPDAARAVLDLAMDFSGGDALGDDATIVVVDVSDGTGGNP